jgi:RHS repeat-associated protein
MKTPICFAVLALCTHAALAADPVQNTTSQFDYDPANNLIHILDPLGRSTNYGYDALNRRQQILQPMVNGVRPQIQVGFDGLDQPSQVSDPRNLVTRYSVDGLGNQSRLTSPDTGTTLSSFDATGNLINSTDARGIVAAYTYDALNRLSTISWPGMTGNRYLYDQGAYGVGHLTRMLDESGQTDFTYEQSGRLLRTQQTVGSGITAKLFSVASVYGTSGGVNGRMISLTYPSGNQINYGYDAAGRITSVTLIPLEGGSVPLLTNIGYRPFGEAQSWTWGNSTDLNANTYARSYDLDGRITSYPLGNALRNGVTRSVTYDAASRIVKLTDTAVSGNTVQTYGYDASGPIASANINQTFDYDDLDRVTHYTGVNANQTFQYDASGNRTQSVLGSYSSVSTLDPASNKLLAVTSPGSVINYSYDAAGNIKTDGKAAYSFAANGRMRSVTGAGGTTTYLYNALGQRVMKSGADTIYFVYDNGGRLLGEYDASGHAIQETVYLGDQPVVVLRQDYTGLTTPPAEALLSRSARTAKVAKLALSIPVPDATVTTVYYVYADHLNTARVITRASDNVAVWRWDNADPYGVTPPIENPSGAGVFAYNPRFPGQYFDRETNLHYNYFRDYDPQTGRFVQSDPVGLRGGINTYAYVGGNPLSFIDPFGLAKDSITAHIESAIIRGDKQALSNLAESGGLNPAQQQLAEQGLRSIDVMGRTTNSTSRIADAFGKTNREIKRAIEQCKQEGLPRNGPTRNPDIRVDYKTGEVYPELGDGRVGDSIGNLFEYLK